MEIVIMRMILAVILLLIIWSGSMLAIQIALTLLLMAIELNAWTIKKVISLIIEDLKAR